MNDSSYARVQQADLSKYRRVIAVSDIHGDADGFLQFLRLVEFSDEDALVIVGDILEKGKRSLDMLHLAMEMTANGNTFVTEGNNDAVFSDWYSEEISGEDVLWYLKNVHSTITEMADALELPWNTGRDVEVLKEAVKAHYGAELDFLLNLPCILDTDLATFVHAGLRPGSIYHQDREYCLTVREFHKKAPHFDKPVVVGHWPTTNYSRDIISFNAMYNETANVYSIDGGLSTKPEGQINYLIFENGTINAGYYDALPRIRALEDQCACEEFITLVFPDTVLNILESGEKDSLCYFPAVDRTLSIQNQTLYEYKRNTYCSDVTTYALPICAGETLSFCKKTKDGIYVKKDGIMGLYRGKYVFI